MTDGRCILKPRGDCARLSGGHIDVKKRRKESSLKDATPPLRLTSDLFSSSASTPRRRGLVTGNSIPPVVGVLRDAALQGCLIGAPGGLICRALLRHALFLQDLPHLLGRDRDVEVRHPRCRSASTTAMAWCSIDALHQRIARGGRGPALVRDLAMGCR